MILESEGHLRQDRTIDQPDATKNNTVLADMQCVWLVMGCRQTGRCLQVAPALYDDLRVTWAGEDDDDEFCVGWRRLSGERKSPLDGWVMHELFSGQLRNSNRWHAASPQSTAAQLALPSKR